MAFTLHPEPSVNWSPVYTEILKFQWPRITENSFMNNATKFLMTNDNMKPMHIQTLAMNTEFLIQRGSDTLLIVVGESWTYGESLSGIGTGAGMFNIQEQLENCMGPRMAEVTGWDLYQFAVPGNCNLYMHLDLKRILKYVATLGYKQVKVVLQMTENSRELPLRDSKNVDGHSIKRWLNASAPDNPIDIVNWLEMYDEIFYDSFQNLLNEFNACPIEGVLWRNFTRPAGKTSSKKYNFKRIEPTFITYTAKLVNHDHTPPMLMNAYSFDQYIKNFKLNLTHPDGVKEFLNGQMDLIEKLFNYIHGNKTVLNLAYHHNHPSKTGHLVWAHHIVREAGWKDI